MKKVDIGGVIQISPFSSAPERLWGCLATVISTEERGVRCYIQQVGPEGQQGPQVHCAVRWADLEPTGGEVYWRAEGT